MDYQSPRRPSSAIVVHWMRPGSTEAAPGLPDVWRCAAGSEVTAIRVNHFNPGVVDTPISVLAGDRIIPSLAAALLNVGTPGKSSMSLYRLDAGRTARVSRRNRSVAAT